MVCRPPTPQHLRNLRMLWHRFSGNPHSETTTAAETNPKHHPNHHSSQRSRNLIPSNNRRTTMEIRTLLLSHFRLSRQMNRFPSHLHRITRILNPSTLRGWEPIRPNSPVGRHREIGKQRAPISRTRHSRSLVPMVSTDYRQALRKMTMIMRMKKMMISRVCL